MNLPEQTLLNALNSHRYLISIEDSDGRIPYSSSTQNPWPDRRQSPPVPNPRPTAWDIIMRDDP